MRDALERATCRCACRVSFARFFPLRSLPVRTCRVAARYKAARAARLWWCGALFLTASNNSAVYSYTGVLIAKWVGGGAAGA